MRSWLRTTFSILLGVMILVTGNGMTLAKMVCMKSGYTTISVSQPDECCKHEHQHPPVTLEEKCCDISSMHIAALQYLTSASQNIQKSMVCVDITSSLSAFDYAQSHNTVSIELRRHSFSLASSYPPVRILTRTFLI